MTYPPTQPPDETEPTDNPMEEGAEPPPPSTDEATAGAAPETVNLVPSLLEDKLTKYGEDVVRRFEVDWAGMEKYRTRRANIMRLALGQLPPPPDDGFSYARVHYPIVMTSTIRMHARVYDQQFPSNGEFFGVKPTDQNDLDRTIRVAKHLNWQVAHKIPEYVPNHDNLIMQWLLYGSAFSVMYWNPTENRPCHETCRTEDIVIPYTESPDDPHMANVSRITRVIRLYKHDLEKMAKTGYYDQKAVDSLFEGDNKDQTQSSDPPTNRSGEGSGHSMTTVIDEAQGVKNPATMEGDRPREILEQHHWCDIGDGFERPVITAVDKQTKKVLGLFLREDEDPEDRARYNREKAANDAQYEAAKAKWQVDLARYYQQTQTPPGLPGLPTQTPMSMPGVPTQTPAPMPGATDSTLPGMAPQMPAPPPPPVPPPEPAQPKMIPIHFFTHYICIPNPEGFYGWGIGFLLEGHNMVADTIAAQLVDAGTLANSFTFLYSKYAKLTRGDLKVSPGKGVEVDLTPEQMKGAIMPIEFPGPNPAMAEFVKDQKQEAEELSGAGEILSGEVGGSNETATTTQIRISQALASIAILNKRYTRARTCEAQKLARLNSVYLQDWEYFSVVDPAKPGVVQEQSIARIDYLEDTDITVTADPRMASQPQRIADAQTALQAIMANPLTANDPMLVAAGQKGLFKAMDRPDLVAALDQMVSNMMAQQQAQAAAAAAGQPPQQGGGQPNQAGKSPKPAKPQAQPQGPAVPMPSRVPNAGPAPANGLENGQGT